MRPQRATQLLMALVGKQEEGRARITSEDILRTHQGTIEVTDDGQDLILELKVPEGVEGDTEDEIKNRRERGGIL